MMDKCAARRSIIEYEAHHDGHQWTSGWLRPPPESLGGQPDIGSATWKLKGEVNPSVAPHMGLGETKYARYSESGSPGFLDSAYTPFTPYPNGPYAGSYAVARNPSLVDMKLNGVTLDRLQDCKSLLRGLDNLRRAAGRDHGPQANCALLAGGGLRTGQAIGATNRLGEYPVDQPIHMQEVVSTLDHNLGVDAMTATLNDPTGRPHYLVEHRDTIRELV